MSAFNEAVLLADIQPTDRVVDLGCGDAADLVLAKALVDRNLFTLAVDETPQEWPTRLVARRVPGFMFVRANIRSLPLASESFDVALIGWVMARRDDWFEIFKECHSVLRNGGRLLVTTAVEPSHKRRWRRRRTAKMLRLVDFIELLGMAGFRADPHHDDEDDGRAVIVARKSPNVTQPDR